MDEVIAMQYRRGTKRLQILILPWAGKYSISAMIRFWDQHTTDATHGWRYFPAQGMSITLAVTDTERFVADAGVEEILQSPWINNGAVLELRDKFTLESTEMSDLRTDQIPKSLFRRVAKGVDNWA